MRAIHFAVAVIAVLAVFPLTSHATTRHVCPEGKGGQSTIQAALSATSTCRTIENSRGIAVYVSPATTATAVRFRSPALFMKTRCSLEHGRFP